MGPLHGIRVLELGGIGPGPFASMLLSDLGAEVVRVDRPQAGHVAEHQDHTADLLLRGRRSLAINLKDPAGLETVLTMIERADVLIDPFRPGVAERLGMGPDVCMARNPRLIFGRMTGWGQEGPYASVAGHDINYVALTGILAAMGRRSTPPPPALNLIGDFGGGGMLLGFGIACALVERARSGRGQVIDAAMVDGATTLFTSIVGFANMGVWSSERESNFIDGGAHYYDTYGTSDNRFVTIGPIEPQFYAELLERLGLDPAEWPQDDRSRWPELSEKMTEIFEGRTRDEWCDLLEGTDVCFAPVLTLDEAAEHPHMSHRGVYVEAYGQRQPAPVPRFSRTPGEIQGPPAAPGEHTAQVLADWGLSAGAVAGLRDAGVVTEGSPAAGSRRQSAERAEPFRRAT